MRHRRAAPLLRAILIELAGIATGVHGRWIRRVIT
jgi:hypothetical protein